MISLSSLFSLKNNFSYFSVFIYLFLFLVVLGLQRLSLVAASGDYFSLRCTDLSLRCTDLSLRCTDLSLRRLLLLQSTGSRRTDLRSCGMQAQQFYYMGSAAPLLVRSPEPGLEPTFPALAGGLLSTAPPGKPLVFLF